MSWSSRWAVVSGLGATALLCWAWIAPMAVDMYGSMSGLSAWMMTSMWDTRHLLLLWLMWAVMMAAMMLPSAMPLLLLYDSVLRRRQDVARVAPLVYAMAGGYLLAWAAFSVAATALQRGLSLMLVMNPMMEMSSRGAIGATLLLAAAYQFTPLKNRCLSQCRSPLAFVMQRWRRGAAGAVRMGAEHGLYCVGCCWALMLLLFAGGVMNLTVIVGLTAVVLIEKLAPAGAHVSRVLGALMAATGVWLVLA
jgi:predicted metal-binding membrane protein